jgi:hypothetical protein
MLKLLGAIVNLLTLISVAVVNAVNRKKFEDDARREKDEAARLHENPGRFIADMFGTRHNDSVRSEATANDALRDTDKTDIRRNSYR